MRPLDTWVHDALDTNAGYWMYQNGNGAADEFIEKNKDDANYGNEKRIFDPHFVDPRNGAATFWFVVSKSTSKNMKTWKARADRYYGDFPRVEIVPKMSNDSYEYLYPDMLYAQEIAKKGEFRDMAREMLDKKALYCDAAGSAHHWGSGLNPYFKFDDPNPNDGRRNEELAKTLYNTEFRPFAIKFNRHVMQDEVLEGGKPNPACHHDDDVSKPLHGGCKGIHAGQGYGINYLIDEVMSPANIEIYKRETTWKEKNQQTWMPAAANRKW